MTPASKDELEQVCKEICPACAAGNTIRQRTDTLEWIHTFTNQGGFSSAFCLASNYRNKYKDRFSG